MDKSKEENQAYLEKKAREENVVKTPSGLLYQVIKLGDGGPKPTATSDVEVRYRGEFIDGTVFDEATTPVTLNLGGVIKGWTEGIQLMSVGDKYRFFIPYDLGYGENGYGSDIKPYSTLVFEVELVSFK
jgi:FKBP-type peptidyl-prolyl cis-trans isomerase FklB